MTYKNARGVLPYKLGDEPPEQAIRRLRGHEMNVQKIGDAAGAGWNELERDAELGRLVRNAVDGYSVELWRRCDGKGYVAVLGTYPAQGGDTLEEAVRRALGLAQPAKVAQP